MKGLFITLEGGEGSGKSTAINAINEYFLSRGYKTLVSREPGGIKIGEEIGHHLVGVLRLVRHCFLVISQGRASTSHSQEGRQ